MRRTGFFLTVVACIFLFNGCGGSGHGTQEGEAPVVQDLQIKTDTPTSDE